MFISQLLTSLLGFCSCPLPEKPKPSESQDKKKAQELGEALAFATRRGSVVPHSVGFAWIAEASSIPKTNGRIPKMMALGNGDSGFKIISGHFWYQFVKFLGGCMTLLLTFSRIVWGQFDTVDGRNPACLETFRTHSKMSYKCFDSC